MAKNQSEIQQQMMALHLQHQEARARERDMMMQVMMNSMLEAGAGAEAEEQRQIQRAIEESKQSCPQDPHNPNVENMTYEQLLELEEKSGKVSKGLTLAMVRKIPEKLWLSSADSEEQSCSICFDAFERRQKVKKLTRCGHEYHSGCLDKWLQNEKRCPICNEEVI